MENNSVTWTPHLFPWSLLQKLMQCIWVAWVVWRRRFLTLAALLMRFSFTKNWQHVGHLLSPLLCLFLCSVFSVEVLSSTAISIAEVPLGSCSIFDFRCNSFAGSCCISLGGSYCTSCGGSCFTSFTCSCCVSFTCSCYTSIGGSWCISFLITAVRKDGNLRCLLFEKCCCSHTGVRISHEMELK